MTDISEKSFEEYLFPDLENFKFDLQLFAAEDEGRTEEPTEKKIREARERARWPRLSSFRSQLWL